MNNIENFAKKNGQPNFEQVKEKITEKIDAEIHTLNQKAIDESLKKDFLEESDDFSTPETEDLETKITKKKMLKENLENKDYYSLN